MKFILKLSLLVLIVIVGISASSYAQNPKDCLRAFFRSRIQKNIPSIPESKLKLLKNEKMGNLNGIVFPIEGSPDLLAKFERYLYFFDPEKTPLSPEVIESLRKLKPRTPVPPRSLGNIEDLIDPDAQFVKHVLRVSREIHTLKAMEGIIFEGRPIFPKVHSLIKDSNGIVIGYTMDRIPGRTLYDLALSDEAISPEVYNKILSKVYNQVSLLHSRGYAHRDLSLTNIMVNFVNGEPQVQLIDPLFWEGRSRTPEAFIEKGRFIDSQKLEKIRLLLRKMKKIQ